MNEAIKKIINICVDPGKTPYDEQRLARIEALARDALKQNHGVWRWRVRNK